MTENLGYALNTPQLAAGMLYFSENDIKGDYEVMGELTAETEDNIFTNAEKMQNKMIDEAKQKGADGIILSGLERRVTGEETATNSETKLKDDKVKSSTKTETSVKEKKTLRGRLIKFKH
ncbi:MAG: hypothetical protein HYR76_11500 [Ignavibacteria bacterium]|nr:hypothetical protein [Ignavibacteria bacterium]